MSVCFGCEPLENRRLFAANSGAESLGALDAAPAADALHAARRLDAHRLDAHQPKVATATRLGNSIIVRGTAAADTITLSLSSTGDISIVLNGTTKTFKLLHTRSIYVKTFDGNDTVTASGLSSAGIVPYIKAGNGNDTLSSDSSAELDGEAGNDTLTGSARIDVLNGGPGDDIIKSNGGPDLINPGSGNDNVTYPNGDVLLGGVMVHHDANKNVVITGSDADETYTFSKSASSTTAVQLAVGGFTTTIDLTGADTVFLDAKGGTDKVIAPLLVFGVRKFSQKNVETSSQS